jgi:hypothetical protein
MPCVPHRLYLCPGSAHREALRREDCVLEGRRVESILTQRGTKKTALGSAHQGGKETGGCAISPNVMAQVDWRTLLPAHLVPTHTNSARPV